jgi:hypothetical protein
MCNDYFDFDELSELINFDDCVDSDGIMDWLDDDAETVITGTIVTTGTDDEAA